MWLISLRFLRTCYLAHLQHQWFGPQVLGALLDFVLPPSLIPWPPTGSHTGSKRAHKNASSLWKNPDIEGRHEGEPKSPNQRHWLIFAAPSALPGGSQANVATWDEMDIQPPAHPRGTLGLTPPQQHPFSIHHLTCYRKRRSSSLCLSSFCSAAQTHTNKQ